MNSKTASKLILILAIGCLSTSASANQKQLYEDSATLSEGSSNKSMATAGLMAAASAVCVAACTAAVSGPSCGYASMGASAGQAALSQDQQAAAGALPSAGMGVYSIVEGKGAEDAAATAENAESSSAGGDAKGDAPKETDSKGKKDGMACAQAAVLAGQSALSMLASNEAGSAAEENKELANDVKNKNPALNPSFGNLQGDSSAAKGNAGGAGKAGNGTSESECGGQPGEFTIAQVQCVIAGDSRLNPEMLTPQFLGAFKKVSGQDLMGFINSIPKGASPSNVLGQAIGGGGMFGGPSAVAAKFKGLDSEASRFLSSHQSKAYAGGGGSQPASEESDDEGKAMAELLGKMLGKDDKGNPMGPKALIFGMLDKRSPEQIEQDPQISLFDRVTYRYLKTRNRLAPLPWASPYNRAIAGSQ